MLRARLSAFAAFSLIMLLTACGASKPEAVVDAFYFAAAKGDTTKALEQLWLTNMPEAMASSKAQMLIGEVQTRIASNGGLKKVDTRSVTINEANKSAVVDSMLIFANGKETPAEHNLVQIDGKWKISLQ